MTQHEVSQVYFLLLPGKEWRTSKQLKGLNINLEIRFNFYRWALIEGLELLEYNLTHWAPHNSNQLQSLAVYSDTLHIRLCMDCVTLHCPLYLCPHTCQPFVYLFVCLPLFLSTTCHLPCLFTSPSGLFPLIDGQQANTKSDCTCSIRRGLRRRLRSSLLLNSSPSTSRDHPLVI